MDYKSTARVQKKVWGPDDTYLTIEMQVPEDKFKQGEVVEVIVKSTRKTNGD